MKTKRIIGDIASLMLMALAFDSCQKKDDLQKGEGEAQRDVIVTTFYAHSGENDSKTKTSRKENGDLWWSPEDEIMVFCGEASGKFVSQNEESAEIATFVGSFDKDVSTSDVSANGVLAFYPYSEEVTRYGDAVVFTLPSSQSAIAGTFDDDLYPVIARSDNTDLSFYNICGGAKFTVSQEGIKTVTIKGNDSEPLAGKLSVTFDENGIPIVEVVDGEKEIVVTAPNEGTFEVDKEYYIVTIPQHFKYGFTLIYNDGLNVHNEFKTGKAISIKRSKFGALRYLDQELDMIAVTEPIVFEDSKVEELCVANWDTNGDGLLSYAEAAAVQTLGTVFRSNTSVRDFKELKYFTGLTTIESRTFCDCAHLRSVSIPPNVQYLDEEWYGCYDLEEAHIEDIASWCRIHHNLDSRSLTKKLYVNGEKLDLTNLVIPEGVKKIEEYAFYQCDVIETLTMPSTVTTVGVGAFSLCTNLTAVHISDLASWCKIDFEKDHKYNITNPLKYAESLYLNGELITDLVIPEGVREIGDSAFEEYAALKSVTIPAGVYRIGEMAFMDCESLTKVDASSANTCTTIESNAFDNCKSLAQFFMPSNLNSVEESAFENCSALTDVYISDVVSWIEIDFADTYANPLYYAKSLYIDGQDVLSGGYNMVIPEGVENIGSYVFYGWNIENLTIPSSLKCIDDNAFWGVPKINAVYVSDIESWCNIRYLNEFSSPLRVSSNLYVNGSLLTDLVIPEGITTIGWYKFNNCRSLKSVTIPSSVTSIGAYAFEGCSGLTSVTIPSSVTSIRSYAFHGCSALTDVYVLGINAPDLYTKAFDGNAAGRRIYVNGTNLEEYLKSTSVWFTYESDIYTIDGTEVEVIMYTTTDGVAVELKNYNFGDTRLFKNYYENGRGKIVFTKKVSKIGSNTFKDCTNLASITIPDSVTEIGDHAFAGCSNLSEVVLTKGISSIGASAFKDCASLYNVEIPNLESWFSIDFADQYSTPLCYSGSLIVGGETLGSCLVIPEEVTRLYSYAFYNCGTDSITVPSSVTSMEPYAFEGCTGECIINCNLDQSERAFLGSKFTKLVLGDQISALGTNAFEGCTGECVINCNLDHAESAFSGSMFTKLVLGDRVTSIGDYAFSDYSGSTNMIIPEGVTSIGSSAFSGCSGLTSVTIPSSVTSIGSSAFQGCSGLNAVHISDISSWCGISFVSAESNPLYYARSLYLNSELVTGDLVIPEGVASIGAYAFSGCSSLASITIPSSVTSIGSSAFQGCSGLNAVHISDMLSWYRISFESMSSNPLNYAKRLYLNGELVTGDLVIPEGVSSISANTFAGWSDLTRVTIPSSVTAIGSSAFQGCSSLTSVIISDGVTSIGSYAFDSCSCLTSVTIPSSVTSIGVGAFYDCTSLTSVTIPSGVTSIGSSAFSGCSGLTSVTIPSGVNLINSDVFCGCWALRSVTIPSSVTSIGSSAFSGCFNLTDVTIPSGVTSIGVGAFYNCTSLTSVTIPSGIKSIAELVFCGCRGLTSVIIPSSVPSIGSSAFKGCSGLTSVTIPSSVTSIGASAFENCSGLTSVTIPSRVTSIGASAFEDCI